ncbi:TIGR04423 family type III CRISPR-associated protein [Neolewinella lacunae]|uniref:TIGR04423 family type III CRISPR-associated protein n=1 Tax=Neolewinella lacunae TaxID=1517758 RepID=A0A923TDV5_9BACT|nr:TIGR04423 family type III CRISPR-associated protein [Neolewinella lacunae]MBC6995247.1 TIGR04423 family type III CRISPR-associated protein [Neolewinella lacunae]MDN3635444.1 TIGR04423 family type III CRISPR-associated protein [Neolewinella lacunae]
MSTPSNSRRILDQIPTGNQYEGYLWYSDKDKPAVFQPGKDFTDDFSPTTIPFIVEGWLYDRENQKSYAIRYLDGQYLRTEYDLAATEEAPIEYQAHDLQPITHFKVVEHWSPEEDENCAEMEVLRHAWTAFAGFAHPTKK